MRTIASIVAVLLLPATAFGATLKVPQQYETITTAVEAAENGDTIVVSRGVYTERVVVEGKDGLRFVGKKAVWDGAAEGDRGTCLNVQGANVTIQGFRFRNGGVRINGDGATFTKCIVRGADADGVDITGDDASVTKCTFRGCYIGIDIDGDGAVVTRNRVVNMDDQGIEVDGDDAEVTKNTVKVIEDGSGIDVGGKRALVSRNTIVNTDEDNIEVDGDDSVISNNRCMATSDNCIDASGNNLVIEKNTCSMSDEDVMYVYGDNFRIVGNKLSLAVDDSGGLDVSTASKAGGGLIEKNVITEVVEDGIELSGNNVTLRSNKVIGQGSEDDEAYAISGNGNTLEGCQAIDGEGDGFDVSGDGNRLIKCKAVNCLEDGFDISGNGNELVDCQAKDCDAEGLDNEGVGTVLRGGTFTGCRIDIACDIGDGASFATFSPKKFNSGGQTTEPQLD